MGRIWWSFLPQEIPLITSLSLSLDKDTSTICTLEQILSNSKFLPPEHLHPNKSSVFHRAVFNYQIHLSTSSFNQNGSEEQWQFLLQWGSCLHLHPLPLWRPGSEGRKIVEEHDIFYHIGVSKYTGGPPKWMVYIMENPMNKWMIWGQNPLFLEKPKTTNIFMAFHGMVTLPSLVKNNPHQLLNFMEVTFTKWGSYPLQKGIPNT